MKILNWIESQQNDNDGMCCPILDILPSPITDHYRNKCEFTIGLDINGLKTVGFRLKRYM